MYIYIGNNELHRPLSSIVYRYIRLFFFAGGRREEEEIYIFVIVEVSVYDVLRFKWKVESIARA